MRNPEIAILGAGMSGLCMGIQLKQAGLDSFTIFEKADEVGGTWRDNIYPGVACDVPSHLYSYSFELNPEWSRLYSPGDEIQDYCVRCADEYGLRPHLRTGCEILSVDFVEGRWRIRMTDGEEHHADVVVSALGGLHKPHTPEIPGLEDFAGVHFHSARWNHEHDLRGKRVGVIGSAASAIQIVPEIAEATERLNVFQRTPNWIVPRNDRNYSDASKRRFRRFRFLARLHRFSIYALLESRFPAFLQGSVLTKGIRWACKRYIASQIADPALREKLTPDYLPGCKRLLVSDDFYSTLARDDVDVVTSEIERITERGIQTLDGTLHEVDTIVFATGFEPFNFLNPLEVHGLEGRPLSAIWEKGVEAHRTVAVPGFPNFFMLLGPNSGLGHNSVIIMIEAQVSYVLKCIQEMRARGLAWIDPRTDVSAQFNRALQRDLGKTIWASGCKSWYMDDAGRIFALWPSSTLRYMWDMRKPDLREYLQTPQPPPSTG